MTEHDVDVDRALLALADTEAQLVDLAQLLVRTRRLLHEVLEDQRREDRD